MQTCSDLQVSYISVTSKVGGHIMYAYTISYAESLNKFFNTKLISLKLIKTRTLALKSLFSKSPEKEDRSSK